MFVLCMELDHRETLPCASDCGRADVLQLFASDCGRADVLQFFACRPACLASQRVGFNSEDGHPCTHGMDRPPQTSKL